MNNYKLSNFEISELEKPKVFKIFYITETRFIDGVATSKTLPKSYSSFGNAIDSLTKIYNNVNLEYDEINNRWHTREFIIQISYKIYICCGHSIPQLMVF